MIILKSDREIDYMRDAGKIVAQTLVEIQNAVKPGVSTLELDKIAEKYIISCGAIPAFKGYGGFPATICSSINEEVVHGIPGLKKLKNGDNVSIDVGAVINGYNGDSAVTFPVGEVTDEMQELLNVTEQSLYKGIEQAIDGNRLGDISNAVQTCAEKHSYGIVRDYVGHGIGRKMHEDPQIPNFGAAGRGPRLKAGMALAIEPMINLGTHEVKTLHDGWTVVTKDKKPSAHFEHTIVVTDGKPEILTKR
ncbi:MULTISPECIES: type I methionyl aminopeptidase [Anaerosinus]|uniref:Methionine aminopeptidase n=1 Tax=Selenobaculum gibii TaxID=3054208 RepID=A0A9Y2AEH4_9FIRM|nr:type I methionyl aminopeptidase [Selenobaculum gbiensis]WIW70075.1 type I methionyl aminopeptidase [Selenobaculum gbiensis]